MTSLRFTVAWVKGYISVLCFDWQIGITIRSSHVSRTTNVKNQALWESRTSIPCSADMYCQYMTDHPFLLNMQVYSCKEHTHVKSMTATYQRCCTGLCDSECGVCAAYTTTTDILKYTVCHIRLWFISVFMQREERHWSNKSCSYLCSDPVQHPAAASDQILAG